MRRRRLSGYRREAGGEDKERVSGRKAMEEEEDGEGKDGKSCNLDESRSSNSLANGGHELYAPHGFCLSDYFSGKSGGKRNGDELTTAKWRGAAERRQQ